MPEKLELYRQNLKHFTAANNALINYAKQQVQMLNRLADASTTSISNSLDPRKTHSQQKKCPTKSPTLQEYQRILDTRKYPFTFNKNLAAFETSQKLLKTYRQLATSVGLPPKRSSL
ncbi:MAG: hypothetical protein VKJ06_08580 [Vampirovibrionales bacterium]|nr:hypothetical protein [Vampirovibrionales bacterium]